MIADANEDQTEAELERYLPADLPQRKRMIRLSRRHLALLSQANQHLNLTAITSPRESVIKHVLDSILPAQALGAAQSVLDIGSGAGFPGIPLAIVRPDRWFVLAESVKKKARFLERVVADLGLSNVEVYAGRAERWLKSGTADVVIVRAVGSTRKLLELLGPVGAHRRELLFYKGPAGERELRDAQAVMSRLGLRGEIALRYRLPEDMGERCILRFVSENG